MKMQESVLRRVRMVEEKHGITYAKTDGRLYKALRVSYTLLFIYTMGINLLFICGMLITRLGTDNFKGILNSLITVIVCTVLIIAGYVLSFTRFKLVSGILSVLPEIMLVVVFGSIMKDSLGVMGFKVSYFWRHFAPLLILVILMAVTTVIAVRARIKTEKQYKRFWIIFTRFTALIPTIFPTSNGKPSWRNTTRPIIKKYTRKVSRFPKKIRRNNAGIPPEPRTLLKLSCNKTEYGI